GAAEAGGASAEEGAGVGVDEVDAAVEQHAHVVERDRGAGRELGGELVRAARVKGENLKLHRGELVAAAPVGGPGEASAEGRVEADAEHQLVDAVRGVGVGRNLEPAVGVHRRRAAAGVARGRAGENRGRAGGGGDAVDARE